MSLLEVQKSPRGIHYEVEVQTKDTLPCFTYPAKRLSEARSLYKELSNLNPIHLKAFRVHKDTRKPMTTSQGEF